MSHTEKSLYEFGGFRLDPGRRLLWKQDQPVQLQPKAFDTLLALVQHNDRVVSKDELMKLVWKDAFVEESNLTQNIFVLRKTLGETAAEHRFIVTVPGRGYRFAEMVRTIEESDYVVMESHSQSRVIIEEEDVGPADDTVTVGFPRHSTEAISQRRPRSKLVPAGVAVCAAIVAALGIYAIGGRKAKPAFQTMTMVRVTNGGEVKRAAISPDGKYLVLAAGEPGKVRLWVRQVATHSAIQILPQPAESVDSVAYSPDGNYVYYVLRNGAGQPGWLFQVPTLGGQARKIADGVDSPVSFSPDARNFAFIRRTASEGNGLILRNLDTGLERKLAERMAPEGFTGLGLAWSADGKQLAVSAYASGMCHVMTIPAGGGQLRPIGAEKWLHIRQVVWLADSSGLVLIGLQSHNSSGQIWHLSFPAGKARRITNDLNDYKDLSLTADSRTLFAVQGELISNIWTLPGAKAAQAVQVTSGVGTQDGVFGLQWSKDGSMLYASLAGGTRQLWFRKPGGEPRQITTDAELGFFSTPSICPDGRTVVYGAGRFGSASIWRLDADGEKTGALIPPGTNGGPSCSPDGRWVYYNSLGKYYSVWRVPAGGGRPEQITHFPSVLPYASPDGQWVAYEIADPHRSGFGIVPASGGQPAKVFEIPHASLSGTAIMRWSPASDAIDFVDTRAGVSNIWRQPIEGGAPQQVTDFSSGVIFNFVWLPNGKDMAVARGSTSSDVVRIQDF